MAILFGRIPESELGTKYTHFGVIHGWVPVYIGEPDNQVDGPVIAVRNGWPEFLEPLGRWVYNVGSLVAELTMPGFECDGWEIAVRGRLTADSGADSQEVHP